MQWRRLWAGRSFVQLRQAAVSEPAVREVEAFLRDLLFRLLARARLPFECGSGSKV